MPDIETIPRRIDCRPTKRVAFAVTLKDNWTMTRHGYLVNYRVVLRRNRSFANFDLFLTNDGVLPSLRSLVAPGIFWIKLFAVQVLHVRSDIRKTPGDALVMANDHTRDSRRTDAGDAHAGSIQVHEIPNRGCCRRQMRIVRE